MFAGLAPTRSRRRLPSQRLYPGASRPRRPGGQGRIRRRHWWLANKRLESRRLSNRVSRRAADLGDDLRFQFCVAAIRASSAHPPGDRAPEATPFGWAARLDRRIGCNWAARRLRGVVVALHLPETRTRSARKCGRQSAGRARCSWRSVLAVKPKPDLRRQRDFGLLFAPPTVAQRCRNRYLAAVKLAE